MLKKQVIFVGGSAEAAEHRTFHEMMRVRSEAIDDVMIIIDIHHRNLSIR